MNHLRVAVLVITLSAAILAAPVAADNVSDDSDRGGQFGFTELPYDVEPPETAEMDVVNTGGESFDFEIESRDGHFHLEADVEGNDNVTILLDTANVSADDPDAYLSAADADVRNITVHTNEVDDELPGGSYYITAMSDDSGNSGSLVVEPSVQFDFDRELEWADLKNEPTHTISGTTSIKPGNSLQIRLETSDDESFLLEDEVIVDEDGRFETTFDLTNLPKTHLLDVTAERDGLTKGTAVISIADIDADDTGNQDGNNAAESNGIVIVHGGDELELEAAPDQQITGEADLDAGQVVEVELHSEGTFFLQEETEIDEHGVFELDLDLDYVEPGTDFVVDAQSATDPEMNVSVPGTVTEPAVSDDTTVTEHEEGKISDSADEDDSLFAGSSTFGIGLLAVGTVLSVVGVSVILGVGRSGSLRNS
ncbi:hypothetical protein C481_08056 [Natrialba asiatica DSM 12278]|uniref:Uncharacterized protein n=1 Tax=Natrialba asiatica (strain ATCC 700177 / DSM 12278 / JCM 9576 / FERM P-10747 / NBRC 102637 / 172P1) TaxID=29540 RepID=M0AVN3_NATA1|nr:hypothetical protein C481_08056 [Natrialba asiatica DSM 12278]